jgi:benzoyl-CoA 2,3-dioxygenase component B
VTMAGIDYSQLIPNNVHLSDDRRLQRALESWQPHYLDWWKETGPAGALNHDVYLRTAISAESDGWAQFGYVKMPDYRWGIFLSPPEPDRKIAFGAHKGEPVWQEVPGEYRSALRRIITIQGDTEPASVEQQRQLGATAPSLYDLRNLFQVNVEEGRHLWAMVYLLHAYFGRDGREEAEELLARRSGDADKPRILGAFNEKTTDWLSFFMFTMITDRDGKYQLAALAESGFDPLSRTTRFMLTEEAHHLFVGESGIGRIIERTCQVMKETKSDDVRKFGVIDLNTLQKYLNFHFSVTADLYGAEVSTNAAGSYQMGIKGRFEEGKIGDDHKLEDVSYAVLHPVDGGFRMVDVPALNALNERLRQDWVVDIQKGVDRWNKIIARQGIDFKFTLPHLAFHRAIGHFNHLKVTPQGKVISEQDWKQQESDFLPSDEDRAYVISLMGAPVLAPGKFANWIAPPARGINNQPVEFEYVRFS